MVSSSRPFLLDERFVLFRGQTALEHSTDRRVADPIAIGYGEGCFSRLSILFENCFSIGIG